VAIHNSVIVVRAKDSILWHDSKCPLKCPAGSLLPRHHIETDTYLVLTSSTFSTTLQVTLSLWLSAIPRVHPLMHLLGISGVRMSRTPNRTPQRVSGLHTTHPHPSTSSLDPSLYVLIELRIQNQRLPLAMTRLRDVITAPLTSLNTFYDIFIRILKSQWTSICHLLAWLDDVFDCVRVSSSGGPVGSSAGTSIVCNRLIRSC
jgi:hypothetical protein